MNTELKEILERVEELRQKLHRLAETKDLADPEVLAASRAVDEALNEYHRLLFKKLESFK